jgi:hypothetical protein
MRGDRYIGEDDPANVRSDGTGGEIFVRLCETWVCHRFWVWQMLMFTGRTKGGRVLPEIEEMESELTKVIEDFDRAVNVESLRSGKNIGKHSLSQSSNCILSGFMWKSKSSCLDGLCPLRPAITRTSVVWKAPANLSLIKSWPG